MIKGKKSKLTIEIKCNNTDGPSFSMLPAKIDPYIDAAQIDSLILSSFHLTPDGEVVLPEQELQESDRMNYVNFVALQITIKSRFFKFFS